MACAPPAWGYRRRRRGPLAYAMHQARELGLYGRARTAERALAAGTVLGATGATLGAVGMSMLGMGAIGAVLGAGAGAAAALLGAKALAS